MYPKQSKSQFKAELVSSRELFERFLLDEEGTKKVIVEVLGEGEHPGLPTPEARACWRVGYETQTVGGWIYRERRDSNDVISWTARGTTEGHFLDWCKKEFDVTGLDNYYRCLGASMRKRDGEAG